MAENPLFPFSIGETVVYPNQGLCNITGIEEKEVANQKLMFIQLVRQLDGAKVMVPTDKALHIGLRKIATRSEALAVIEFLKSNSDKASLDWKTRARTNTEHMSRGGIMGLAEVVKALQVLSELRPLPAKERELYNNARGMLVEEMAVSLELEPGDAEDTIDVILFPVGQTRPRRTIEEFQLGLEIPLLLSLEEDALLEESEEDKLEEELEEDAEEDLEDDFEESFKEGLEEEGTEKVPTKNAHKKKTNAPPSSKTSAAKEKKKGKTNASKTGKRASGKPSSAGKPKKETSSKTAKAASKTNKTALRASGTKRK